MGPASPAAAPADASVGAFSDDAPWLVQPDRMSWRAGVDTLRARSRAEVPRLLATKAVPPGLRIATVGARLAVAIGGWYWLDRPKGASASRSGLSRRLRRAFERLGPTYIKLGQIISSGEGIFPTELVSEFRLLRDRVPPEPFDVVRRTVEDDLGRSLESVFRRFDREPLAAASIAQVHSARLHSGEEVVVKVQRPRVSALVRRDLAAMSRIAPLLVGRIPVTALANPPALVEVFAETIAEELDFRLEAQNMLDVAHVLATTGSTALVVPRPHPQMVTKRVLVMERLNGFSWDDVTGMHAAGIDTSAVVRAGMVSFMEGAMLFGVFHGDLHGGNLMVQADGRVALLDYGITGRLEESRRLAFLRLLIGGSVRDVRMQVEALCALGALPPDTDIAAVIADLGLDKPPIDPMQMTPDQLTAEIRDLTKALLSYGARLPKEIMLFVKNLLFLDGAMATLAPDVDLLAEVAFLAQHFSDHHGDRLARDVGIAAGTVEFDMAELREVMGIPAETETITYRDVKERRELIRRRMEERKARKTGDRGRVGLLRRSAR
ncbi:MAG: AarF/UbiB family protein [Actinomycetota bacterium]|nr:AarF/UbiB family protein [Actinomycetota bacterium]